MPIYLQNKLPLRPPDPSMAIVTCLPYVPKPPEDALVTVLLFRASTHIDYKPSKNKGASADDARLPLSTGHCTYLISAYPGLSHSTRWKRATPFCCWCRQSWTNTYRVNPRLVQPWIFFWLAGKKAPATGDNRPQDEIRRPSAGKFGRWISAVTSFLRFYASGYQVSNLPYQPLLFSLERLEPVI